MCSICDDHHHVDGDRCILDGATPNNPYVMKEIQVQWKYYCIRVSSVTLKLRSVYVLTEPVASAGLLRNMSMTRFQVSAAM